MWQKGASGALFPERGAVRAPGALSDTGVIDLQVSSPSSLRNHGRIQIDRSNRPEYGIFDLGKVECTGMWYTPSRPW